MEEVVCISGVQMAIGTGTNNRASEREREWVSTKVVNLVISIY